MVNAELNEAYAAKQKAFDRMIKSEDKLNELGVKQNEIYIQISIIKQDLIDEKKRNDKAYSDYRARRDELSTLIGEKIARAKECDALGSNFLLMSQDRKEDPNKAAVYAEGARFFAQLSLKMNQERNRLLKEKRGLKRPNYEKYQQMSDKLNAMRAEQECILEDFHAAKNAYSINKAEFERLNAIYKSVRAQNENSSYDKGGDTAIVNNASADDATLAAVEIIASAIEKCSAQENNSARPKKLEFDIELVTLANIPEEYWKDCEIEERADGEIDIFYGGVRNKKHGHAVIKDGNVTFNREPMEMSTAKFM